MTGVLLRPKWPGARRDEGAYPNGSVTEKQRSPRPFSAQPCGPQVFWPPASLLAPHRPVRVCSLLAPRGRPKPLAAEHQSFMRHITRVLESQNTLWTDQVFRPPKPRSSFLREEGPQTRRMKPNRTGSMSLAWSEAPPPSPNATSTFPWPGFQCSNGPRSLRL